ncbi:MAG: periplasmic heavy metal sensor [Desulfobacula sp.]|nr:periplasmic heavy metal sensor [Desulfobacula sp.]
MKKSTLKKILVLGTFFLVTGFAAYAFAYGGGYSMGGGYGMMNGGYHMGYGGYMMGSGMYGNGQMWQNVSTEDQKKMQTQMDEFFSSTRELRDQYYEKRIELNREYSKSEKDQNKIDSLQKELFDLSANFEKQRFDHMTGMQKLFAGNTNGFSGMGGYGGCF